MRLPLFYPRAPRQHSLSVHFLAYFLVPLHLNAAIFPPITLSASPMPCCYKMMHQGRRGIVSGAASLI